MIRFYTLPPESVPYPYIIVNLNDLSLTDSKGLSYILTNRKYVRSVIIDPGIEVFRNSSVKDYPEGVLGRIYKAVRYYCKIKSILRGAEVFVTVPDYPDDYSPRALWLSDQITNIERTLENVLFAVDRFSDVNWLIPVQGWNKQPISILRSLNYYREYGILKKYSFFAVANLCVEGSIDIIIRTLKIARANLYNKRIHAFGINLRSVGRVYNTFVWKDPFSLDMKRALDSFDSKAWTKPNKEADLFYLKKQGRKRQSWHSEKDKIVFFWSWLYALVFRYNVELEGISRKKIEEEFYKALEE